MSDHLNAPNITRYMYLEEKAYFSGAVISSMLYGTHRHAAYNPVYSCRIHLVHSRNHHRAVLPMYGRTV